MGRDTLNPQVVVLRNGDRGETEVLLVKRVDIGAWTLPGGRREEGESLESAAVRETKEETGYDIALVRPLGTYTLPKLKGMGRAFVFIGRTTGGTPRISEETSAVRWYNVKKLPYTLLPFNREKVYHAVEGKSNVDIIQPHSPRSLVKHYLFAPRLLIRMLGFQKKYEEGK